MSKETEQPTACGCGVTERPKFDFSTREGHLAYRKWWHQVTQSGKFPLGHHKKHTNPEEIRAAKRAANNRSNHKRRKKQPDPCT